MIPSTCQFARIRLKHNDLGPQFGRPAEVARFRVGLRGQLPGAVFDLVGDKRPCLIVGELQSDTISRYTSMASSMAPRLAARMAEFITGGGMIRLQARGFAEGSSCLVELFFGKQRAAKIEVTSGQARTDPYRFAEFADCLVVEPPAQVNQAKARMRRVEVFVEANCLAKLGDCGIVVAAQPGKAEIGVRRSQFGSSESPSDTKSGHRRDLPSTARFSPQ